MASLGLLMEHGTSEDILSTIPAKAQYGFKNVDVAITCMDAEKTHLLLGTNIGAAFLYNRESRLNIKLLSESRNDVITSVKLLVGIECQTALGTADGKLTIVVFSHPSSNRAKQVQKYNLGAIHQTKVTCMCWSNNGMKLFTGDRGGNVYVVEMDFEKNKCNATLLLTEQNAIVEMQYRHRILLLSTTERVLLYHSDREENKVVSVGTRPARRGYFGACFNSDTVSASDLRVFCTRPGHRIWVADSEGKVSSTLLMKDLISSDHHHVKFTAEKEGKLVTQQDNQFGRITAFGDKELVIYADSCIFVINHETHRIRASNQNLDGILSVAITTDEIFLLRHHRQLHRISEQPEEIIAKTIFAVEEGKKKEGSSGHLQDVKESFSEMKKSITPLVGALQSRMSNFNAEAEQWTQKIQTQAKVLQKKLPIVATSLFSLKDENMIPAPSPEEASKSGSPAMKIDAGVFDENLEKSSNPSITTSTENLAEDNSVTIKDKSDCDVTKCDHDIKNTKSESCNDLKTDNKNHCDITMQSFKSTDHAAFEKETCSQSQNNHHVEVFINDEKLNLSDESEGMQGSPRKNDQDFLHSQGNPEFHNEQSRKTSVDCHFEKLEKLASMDDGEIVFNSKRKKKVRTTSRNSSISNFKEKEEYLTSDLHSSRLEIDTESSKVTKTEPQNPQDNSNVAESDPKATGLIEEETASPPAIRHYSSGNENNLQLNFNTPEDESISSRTSGEDEADVAAGQDGKLCEIATPITDNTSRSPQHIDGSFISTGVHSKTFINPISPHSDDSSTCEEQSTLHQDEACITRVKGEEVECAGQGLVKESTNEDDGKVYPEDDSRELQQLVIAIHKTTGNKLAPEIVLSPVQTKRKFFPDPESSENYSKNSAEFKEKVQRSEIPLFDDGSDIDMKGKITYVSNEEAGRVQNVRRDQGLGLDSHIGEQNKEKKGKRDSQDRDASFTPSPGSQNHQDDRSTYISQEGEDPTLQKPSSLQFNASRTKEIQAEESKTISMSSSPDDIYGVESGMRDFESEIDSDVDEDSDDEFQFTNDRSSTSKESLFSPSSVDLPYFSSSVPAKLLDSWSQTKSPYQVISISGSDNFIWYVDYYDHIYITEEAGETVCDIKWKMFKKKGKHLAISPSGDIVWLVSRSGKLYAAVLPPSLHLLGDPLEIEWKLVGANVSKVALGVDSGWAFSSSSEIKVQIGLSRAVPYHTSGWELISWTNEKITHLTLSKSAVWCRTDSSKLFTGNPELICSTDFKWEEVGPPFNRDNNPVSIQSITSDFGYVLWAVDDEGSLWFLTEDQKWWQVNISQYINESKFSAPVFMQSLQSSVQRVQRWMAGIVRVQGVAVNNQSVWVVYEKQKIHIARGPLTGCRWDVTTPLGVAKSTRWQHITTSSVFSSDYGTWIGLVWASQQNNEIFSFPSQDVATIRPVTLLPPVGENSSIICLSACKEALWVLMDDGSIFIRSGISSECLQGSKWEKLDVESQLGSTKMMHVSCGTQNVWAVDSQGKVYFRIGVSAVDGHSLPPAWIPIDGCPTPTYQFTQIECGLSDCSVWALDDFANVYVRTGVTVTMPIGRSWEMVPGSHAQQICISNHTVWGLRVSGNLLRRFGISHRNLLGDYWKKLKGRFIKIAVTPYDELWAIDRDQHLRHQFTSIYCPPVAKAQYEMGPSDLMASDWAIGQNDAKDWEFV